MNCEVVQARLISGERPNEDAALAAHVGSCLRCFRTATDMREVPRLAALLREGPGQGSQGLQGLQGLQRPQGSIQGETAYDPGARFWETFPIQVAAAWVSSRPPGRAGWWERGSLWLRRPVPAALTGALCAVGLALLLLRPGAGPEGTPVLSAETGLAGELDAQVGVQIGSDLGEAEDESVGELDIEALATLRDQLDRALSPSDLVIPPMDSGDDGAATDPAKLAEELEMLDESALLALREKLGPRI
jgi:hypothetical protein